MIDAHSRASVWTGNDAKDLIVQSDFAFTFQRLKWHLAAVNPYRHLATTAQRSQCRALHRDGEPRDRVIEKTHRIDGRRIVLARLDSSAP